MSNSLITLGLLTLPRTWLPPSSPPPPSPQTHGRNSCSSCLLPPCSLQIAPHSPSITSRSQMPFHLTAPTSSAFILVVLGCWCTQTLIANAEDQQRDTHCQCDRRCRCRTFYPSCFHPKYAAEMCLARSRPPISLALGCGHWTSATAVQHRASSAVAPVPNPASYLNGPWLACAVATASPTTQQLTRAPVGHFRYTVDSAVLAAHATTSASTTQLATT